MKKFIATALAVTCIAFTATPVLAATLDTDSAQAVETVEKTREAKKEKKTNSIKTLLDNGTISQDTYDAITTYLSENKPEKTEKREKKQLTEEEKAERMQKREAALEDGTIEKTHHKNKMKTSDKAAKKSGLFSKLLEEGVITQAEYDTIIAAISSN